MNFKFSLTPGQTKGINLGEGDFFAVVLCPGDLEIKVPGGEFALFGQGDSYTLPPGQSFTRLEVRNPSASNGVQVLLFAGFGRYEQRRQSVIEPDTEFSSSATTSLAGHATLDFDGFPSGDRIRRKQIQISNLDASLPLQLIDQNGNVGLSIPGGHSITLPISKFVQLYNPNGSAVSFAFSEIWWTL
jgi:hypothetical protein